MLYVGINVTVRCYSVRSKFGLWMFIFGSGRGFYEVPDNAQARELKIKAPSFHIQNGILLC